MTRKLIVVFASIFLSFLATIVLDWGVGLFISPIHELIFPRHAIFNYTTAEFSFQVHTNNLGFRDYDATLAKHTRYRVLAIGDSFTYGWGVNIDDTWPKVLERNLRARNLDTEVANLGQGGSSPADYAAIGQRAIPLLRPDLVVVAVLQADDLDQTLQSLERRNGTSPARPGGQPLLQTVRQYARSIYPNLMEARRHLNAVPPPEWDAVSEWKPQVRQLVSELNGKQKERFDRLDGEVKDQFLRATLNPAIIARSLSRPAYIKNTLALERAEIREAIQEVSKHLARIKEVTERVGGEVIVVSVPHGAYVSQVSLDGHKRMGYDVDESLLETTHADEATRTAAANAGVGFVAVTHDFRSESRKRRLYYRFDGHMNVEGYRWLAEKIEPYVVEQLKMLGR